MEWVNNSLSTVFGGAKGKAAASSGNTLMVRFSASDIWEYNVKTRKRHLTGSMVRVFDCEDDSVIYESDIQVSAFPQYRKMCDLKLSRGCTKMTELAVGFYLVDVDLYRKLPLSSKAHAIMHAKKSDAEKAEIGLHFVMAEKIPIASIERKGIYPVGRLIAPPESAELAQKMQWKEAVLRICVEPDVSESMKKKYSELGLKDAAKVKCYPFAKFDADDGDEIPVCLEIHRELFQDPEKRSVLVGASIPGGAKGKVDKEMTDMDLYDSVQLSFLEFCQYDPTVTVEIYVFAYVPRQSLHASIDRKLRFSHKPNSKDIAESSKVLLGYSNASVKELSKTLRSSNKPLPLSQDITEAVLNKLRMGGAENVCAPSKDLVGEYSVGYGIFLH